jgi:hypothetical protein
VLVRVNGRALEDEQGKDFLADGRKILERTAAGDILKIESVEERDARRAAQGHE